MTVKELWDVSPRSFLILRQIGVGQVEYHGNGKYSGATVLDVQAVSWPMYKSVLLVEISE